MGNLDKQIERIRQGTGLPITVAKEVPTSSLTLSRSDQRNTEAALCEIFDKRILLISYDGSIEFRPLAIVRMIKKSSAIELDSIVVLRPQLSVRERKAYLSNAVPFITSDGEMFLPFMGTRLQPGIVSTSGKSLHETFSPLEQRLALAILFAQLIFERRGRTSGLPEMKPFYVDHDLFCMFGGQRFMTTIGKKVGITNRTTFARATTQLVERGLLKFKGETKDRIYSCQLNSRKFFRAIEPYLATPIQASGGVLVDFDPMNLPLVKPLYNELTGLAKVTMVSSESGIESLVVNRAGRQALDYLMDNVDENSEPVCKLQVSKYDLVGFNELVRQIIDYPEDVVDPVHLYTLFKDVPDERVQGEAEELVDRLWNGD